MKISEHILTEAREILQQQSPLPKQISSAPLFFVAEASDKSVLAFTVVEHGGVGYKVGPLKGD